MPSMAERWGSQEVATTVGIRLLADRLCQAIKFLFVGVRAGQGLLHLNCLLAMALVAP